MSHSIRLCSRCHDAEAHNCAYCLRCKAIVERERYRARRGLTGTAPKRSYKARVRAGVAINACNCGNRACDGLRCESLRYGTAGVACGVRA